MTKKELKNIRERLKAFNDRWVSEGHKLCNYKCPHCGKLIPTRRPTKDMVGPKGYWDSCQICIECGKLNFVVVRPSGKTNAVKV
jgi:hypothetical protein